MNVFAGDSKTAKAGLLCAASAGAVAVVAVGALTVLRIKTLRSLKKLSNFAGAYNLYESTVAYRYNLDAIIKAGVEDDQSYIDAVCKQVLPGIPVKVEAPKFACSAFCAEAPGSVLMGRNYDFKDDTSALLVSTHPKDGYASIAFSALNNLGANMPEESLKGKAAAMLGPFASLDGINEKGVSIAVLTLDSLPTRQNSGKPKINTSLAIRLVLDRAASTQEAIDLLGSYDMVAMAGRDYHFFINDASGDSRVVEYDPQKPARPMVVTHAREITNYYACYASEVAPNRKNGALGHGKERAFAIAEVLDGAQRQTKEVAWKALRDSSQEPNPEDITSNTQWSIVYDNINCTADFVLRRNWGEVFSFVV